MPGNPAVSDSYVSYLGNPSDHGFEMWREGVADRVELKRYGAAISSFLVGERYDRDMKVKAIAKAGSIVDKGPCVSQIIKEKK